MVVNPFERSCPDFDIQKFAFEITKIKKTPPVFTPLDPLIPHLILT